MLAGAELGKVEAVGRAGIDDELRHARRLPLRQLGAVRRGSDLVLRADENERRDHERRAGQVGAWGIESRRGLEDRPSAAGCDFERRVASLRKADGRDPGGVDVRKAGKIGLSAIGVGQGLLEVDGAGFFQAAGRKVVDEQGDIAPGSDPLADRGSLFRQAETGVQKDHGRERACSLRPGEIALDRVALTGAREFDQFIGRGGSAGGEEPE